MSTPSTAYKCPPNQEPTEPEDFKDDPRFHHDMLTAMIMLHEGKNGNPVSFDSASKVAVALMREDDELPLDELRPKQKVA